MKYVAMMANLNNIISSRNGLTLRIKVNHQGQVTNFVLSEILDIINVRINTKIESIACIYIIQLEISKGIGKMCMTLSSKVKRSKYFNIYDIPGL